MRAAEFIVESKGLPDITGDCWISPTNRVFSVRTGNADSHLEVAGRIMNARDEEGQIDAYHELLKRGWIRTGVKSRSATLQAYSVIEANKYFGNIIRKLPLTIARIGVEWIEPDTVFREYTLVEAEKRFK